MLRILCGPKPVHHKTFTAIGKKVPAAQKVAAKNLTKARELTAGEAGSTNVAMFDGTWQKIGDKSHNGVGTAISLVMELHLDYEVLSNYCLTCSRHKALENRKKPGRRRPFPHPCVRKTRPARHALWRRGYGRGQTSMPHLSSLRSFLMGTVKPILPFQNWTFMKVFLY